MNNARATVEIEATLSVPDGRRPGSAHLERHIVRACPNCAANVLQRFARTWNWSGMDVSAQFGDFGRCSHYNA